MTNRQFPVSSQTPGREMTNRPFGLAALVCHSDFNRHSDLVIRVFAI
jgi:hypothetical protein